MPAPPVRAAVLAVPILWALACQGTPPSAPDEPAGPAGLGLSVVTCDGQPATHVLAPGGPGTNGNWFYGTGGKDVIVGTSGNDKIDGGAGADRICLLGGNDQARGGAGKDRLFGDAGTDVLNGGNDSDYLDGGADNDQVGGGKGADELLGGPGDDTLEGGAQADHLQGGDGNDTLDGNGGDDFLEGEGDDDALDGGQGTDDCAGGGQDGDTDTNCEGTLLQLVAGAYHTCALTSAGAAYCWGNDGDGQRGDGTVGTPDYNPTPGAVVGGHTFVSLAAGYYHTCGVRTDGAAYCWGYDGGGSLGDGTAGASSATPGAVTGGHTFASLAAGLYHSCGVRSTDGAAYCWGGDGAGQLGDGTVNPNSATPGAVTGGHTFASLAAGSDHTCGVRTDSTAYCWGRDNEGQLGDGTVGPDNPTPGAVTGGHTWASLAAGSRHTCGVRTDSTAYCWGRDNAGQLGDGTVGPDNPTPGAVTGGHTWDRLDADGLVTCGVRTDGAGYCWGYDGEGGLGDGTANPDSPTPGLVIGGHTWTSLAVGDSHTCGVRTDSAAYCWGRDAEGQLGDGTEGGSTATPGPVVGLP